jgi:hypothetical protein
LIQEAIEVVDQPRHELRITVETGSARSSFSRIFLLPASSPVEVSITRGTVGASCVGSPTNVASISFSLLSPSQS